MEVTPRLERVRVPDTYPRERVVLGELHLLRGRLDGTLEDLAHLIAKGGDGEQGWLRVEEAARLARRALAAAVGAAPSPPPRSSQTGELRVGELCVDPSTRRQWFGEAEFELTPLHHRLLAVMAAEPFRVFGKDELAAEVWGVRGQDRGGAVKVGVCRVRQALVRAGASRGRFMVSLHGVGWALTRPA
jgi:DNA-binding response OmpR family regulator